MTTALQELFALGDGDLLATAGEECVLKRRLGGTAENVRAVVSPLPVVYEMSDLGGAVKTYSSEALMAKSSLVSPPAWGDDFIDARGLRYKVGKVTESSLDMCYHVELSQS